MSNITKSDALKLFNKKHNVLAAACGITTGAVSQWPEKIPERPELILRNVVRHCELISELTHLIDKKTASQLKKKHGIH